MAPLDGTAEASAAPSPPGAMIKAAAATAAVTAAWLLAAGVLSACRSEAPKDRSSGGPPPAPTPAPDSGKPAYLVPIEGDSLLARGQTVWMENCRRCHATGLSGAPIIATGAWGPRAAKGLDTLFAHALNGFEGPTGTQMPARGGNPDLPDDDVKAAVRFMIAYYLPASP